MLLRLLKKILEYNKEIEKLINALLRHENFSLNLNQLIVLDNVKEFELPSLDKKAIGAMHHNLEKLINLGLITKHTNYCQDKRKIKFKITGKGKNILDQINNMMDKPFIVNLNKKLFESFVGVTNAE